VRGKLTSQVMVEKISRGQPLELLECIVQILLAELFDPHDTAKENLCAFAKFSFFNWANVERPQFHELTSLVFQFSGWTTSLPWDEHGPSRSKVVALITIFSLQYSRCPRTCTLTF
jgi:hypothetical protein